MSKSYGETPALIALSLQIAAGECLAVVGESGSGKTTLLRLLNRLAEPDRGAVWLDGRALRELDPNELRRRIGYVPQDGGLLPHWRVQRNVELVPRLRRLADAEPRAHTALELVGLDPSAFAGRWPHELSGGQRQRVALARALAADPWLLLLDEAFNALDAITRADLQDAFDRARRKTAITTVLVTHDLSEALRLADRIAVLRAGRLEQLGSPAAVVNRPATQYVEMLIQRARSSWPQELRT
ncbi:MAG: ATP-binding cassette domain-containing protein [Gemmatimonadota bacterium]